jgi:predicted enzyme related to lactoylglutathione lyase
MSRPIHFEIPADDPARAIAFYETVFGWKFKKWEGPMPYWLITTGADGEPGIDGGLLPRQHPNQPCVNTIGVADLDASVATVERSGGQVAVPKMPIPGVGWLAYCKDTEGHIFGMMQNDPAAK